MDIKVACEIERLYIIFLSPTESLRYMYITGGDIQFGNHNNDKERRPVMSDARSDGARYAWN